MNEGVTKEMRKEVKRFIDTADEKVVKNFYAVMEAETDWWDNLPKKVQTEIDEALNELDNGKGISHEEAIKKSKYADFKYELSTTELEEALWLIEQGDFNDLNDFSEASRKAEIIRMKEHEKASIAKAKKHKLVKPTLHNRKSAA